MVKKRLWQEPLVRSIDQLPPAYGECRVGNTPTPSGPRECSSGSGASQGGTCLDGNGASTTCGAGNGT